AFTMTAANAPALLAQSSRWCALLCAPFPSPWSRYPARSTPAERAIEEARPGRPRASARSSGCAAQIIQIAEIHPPLDSSPETASEAWATTARLQQYLQASHRQ